MTLPQQPRYQLAFLLGWNMSCLEGVTGIPDEWEGPEGQREDSMPDWPNDLNATHEAWKTLTPEQHKIFSAELRSICLQDGHIVGPCRSLSNATPAQRTAALIVALTQTFYAR